MYDELEARMLLLDGQPQAALDRFQALDLEASRRYQMGSLWQAQIGKAEALAALGQRAAAAAAFERAERLENRELIFIPLDRGREQFLAQRERTTRQHLELLLGDGRTEDALELIRRRRIQALSLLQRDERVAALDPQARQAWEQAATDYRRLQRELENAAPAAGGRGPRRAAPTTARRSASNGSARCSTGRWPASACPSPPSPGRRIAARASSPWLFSHAKAPG